ncbi:MAG: Butyryl-CoA dehydrogenase (EC [uncultured Thiotrichaceae bacterium]|uniref:Acyl-coenzyme A dehydrogenase n=1 Tax=uncultured Thiotrichaceae bacterium TaxID=298394 RepID=A0A6S6SAZ1_9GAMM|nr:MAG: Butyryl-CoA dehydrogenase (EC [uncultured Thiotrichaceae bacterium]
MINLLFAILFAGGLITLTYFGVSAVVFTVTMVGLTVLSALGSASSFFLGLGILITLLALPFAIPPLRQRLISKPALIVMGKMLPPISDTEQVAIDAGTVWWDGELFSGTPDWQKLRSSPKPSLTKEEQAFLGGPVEAVCDMSNLWKINHDWNIIPDEIIQYVRDNGFLGMIIPKRYGGLGFSAIAQSEVLLRLSNTGSGVSYLVGVPNSLGPGELLIKYGTEEQKDHYLPRLAKGKEIPCFALTAPNAGSDATSISDTGVVCHGEYEGKQVLGMRLNFSKRYITLAPIATLIGLAFRMQDPDGLLGDVKDYGITCAMIPHKTHGVSIGRRHLPLGDTFLNGPIHGKDVFVPLDAIIGGPDMAGKGWLMLVNCLSVGRAVTLPTTGTVVSKRSLMGSSAYANLRQQFGVPIAKFEGIQKPLARIAGYTYIIDAARLQTIQSIENGENPSVPSAIIKYHCTEMGRQATIDAMDIHGGKAIMKGPKNYIAALYESIPVAITVEGANILTRNLMIFGQGAIRAHPFVLKEMELASADYSADTLREFDEILSSHIGFSLQNIARSFVLGLGVNGDIPDTHVNLVPYYHAINRLSSVFAMTADISMLSLGAKLKFKEMLSARLGDMLSTLYLASMVIKHHEDQNCDEDEWPVVQWSLDHLLHEYQIAFDELMANFPNRFFAMKMQATAFWFGRRFKAPSDELETTVVSVVSANNSARTRLTQGIYLGAGSHNPLANVNAVFLEMLTIKPLHQKLRTAIKDSLIPKASGLTLIHSGLKFGVINKQEAEQLTQFEVHLSGIINVDDFDESELIRKPYTKNEEASWLMAS